MPLSLSPRISTRTSKILPAYQICARNIARTHPLADNCEASKAEGVFGGVVARAGEFAAGVIINQTLSAKISI